MGGKGEHKVDGLLVDSWRVGFVVDVLSFRVAEYY